jgi:hypothetical protein
VSKADELKKKLMSKPVQTIESSQSTVVSGMTDTQEIKMLKTQEIKNTNTQNIKNTRKVPNNAGNVQTTFYLPKEKAKQLKVLSAIQDKTMSELVEEAIDIIFAKYHGQ